MLVYVHVQIIQALSWLSVLVVAFAITRGVGAAEEAQAILAEAVAGNEAYLRRLPPLHWTWTTKSAERTLSEGEVRCNQAGYEVITRHDGFTSVLQYQDGLVTEATTQRHEKGESKRGSIRREARRSAFLSLGGVSLLAPGPEGATPLFSSCTLAELIAIPGVVVQDAVRDGERLRLQINHEKIQQRVWVDPQRSFLIVEVERVQHFAMGEEKHVSTSRSSITAFHDLGDGLFFPKIRESDGDAKSTQHITSVKRLDNWQLVPIKFDPGVHVFDMRVGKVLTAQADGSLVEDEKLTRGFQKSAEERRLAPPPLRASLPTASEPWHWTAYILPGTAFVCGLLGLFWAIRWWQERREAA